MGNIDDGITAALDALPTGDANITAANAMLTSGIGDLTIDLGNATVVGAELTAPEVVSLRERLYNITRKAEAPNLLLRFGSVNRHAVPVTPPGPLSGAVYTLIDTWITEKLQEGKALDPDARAKAAYLGLAGGIIVDVLEANTPYEDVVESGTIQARCVSEFGAYRVVHNKLRNYLTVAEA